MRTLIISSSLNPESRSNYLARQAADWLSINHNEVGHIQLRANEIPGFDQEDLFESAIYLDYYKQAQEAESLILATPVYNWSICSELKKFLEVVGSTDATRKSPFFDKLVSFIFSAGLPHSYMVIGSVAIPLMLDFRCIINPYQAYLHNRDWHDTTNLTDEGRAKLERMLNSHLDLGRRLHGYETTSQWTV